MLIVSRFLLVQFTCKTDSLTCCTRPLRHFNGLMKCVCTYVWASWSVTLREERRLGIFESSVLRRISVSKRDEVIGSSRPPPPRGAEVEDWSWNLISSPFVCAQRQFAAKSNWFLHVHGTGSSDFSNSSRIRLKIYKLWLQTLDTIRKSHRVANCERNLVILYLHGGLHRCLRMIAWPLRSFGGRGERIAQARCHLQ